MTHLAGLELLAAELEVLELEAAAAELAARPARARRRRLFPHEVASGARFDELEAHVDGVAAALARKLELRRSDVLAALVVELDGLPLAERAEFLAGVAGHDPRALSRVLDRTNADAGRFPDLTGDLNRAARLGAREVLLEARGQGVPVDLAAAELVELGPDELKVADLRLRGIPVDHVKAAASHVAFQLPSLTMSGDELEAAARAHVAERAPGALLDPARQVAHKAHGAGRVAAVALIPQPAYIYASELLDSNTCGPCSLVDGRRYATLALARQDYPGGQYRRCEGGARCRGTLVYVWPEEAEPTDPPTIPGAPPPAPGAGPAGPAGPEVDHFTFAPGDRPTPALMAATLGPEGMAALEGATFRFTGGVLHGTPFEAGLARLVNGRLLMVDDRAMTSRSLRHPRATPDAERAPMTPAEVLDTLEDWAATIPGDLDDPVLDTLAVGGQPSAAIEAGGEAAATSDGKGILFYRMSNGRIDLSRPTFDHELGHSTRAPLNRRVAELAGDDAMAPTWESIGVPDYADVLERAKALDPGVVQTPAWVDRVLEAERRRRFAASRELGDLIGNRHGGSDPGAAWAKAGDLDAKRVATAQKRLEAEVMRQREADWQEMVDAGGQAGPARDRRSLDELRDALPAKFRPAHYGFTEDPGEAGNFAIRATGKGTWRKPTDPANVVRPGVSDYGSTSSVEDWAEAWRMILADARNDGLGVNRWGERVGFRDLFPARAAVVDRTYDVLGLPSPIRGTPAKVRKPRKPRQRDPAARHRFTPGGPLTAIGVATCSLCGLRRGADVHV